MEPGSTLSRALCAAHQRSHCVLVGSGTIGLTLALRAIGVEGKPVAIPNGVCLNVPLAVIFAGGAPKYCDIERRTLGLSLGSLRRCTVKPIAAIAVHAYGAVCDIQEIAEYCKKAGIFLIEDAAVAQGATHRGQPVGAFGDCSVLSFGAGKIIDAGGGGAVLTGDRSLAGAVRRLCVDLPQRTDTDKRKLQEFSRNHTRLYNDHYGRDLEVHAPAFFKGATGLKGAFLSSPTWSSDRVVAELGALTKNIRRRQRYAEKLRASFSDNLEKIISYRPPEGSVHWRFNAFVREGRDRVLKALLAEKFLISSWFPSSDLFLGGRKQSGAVTPLSDRVGDEILNIWVNDEIDDQYIEGISARAKQLLT